MAMRWRRFTAAFKKRVALEALRGEQPVQAIAAKHQVHPNQVSALKRQRPLFAIYARIYAAINTRIPSRTATA